MLQMVSVLIRRELENVFQTAFAVIGKLENSYFTTRNVQQPCFSLL
jgi:hypothetical protein